MRHMQLAMKEHNIKCEVNDFLLDCSEKEETIPNKSYSNIQIITYSCSHSNKIWKGCIHQRSAYCLIMAVSHVAQIITPPWHKIKRNSH